MFDYYDYVNTLKEDKLNAEIEKITKQLFKMNPGSPMFGQLHDMLEMAQAAYQDLMYINRYKDQKDQVLEIGTTESTVKTPEYDRAELLNVIVTEYTKDLRDKK